MGFLSRLRKPPKKSNFRTGYQILKYFEIYLFNNSEHDMRLQGHMIHHQLDSVTMNPLDQCSFQGGVVQRYSKVKKNDRPGDDGTLRSV